MSSYLSAHYSTVGFIFDSIFCDVPAGLLEEMQPESVVLAVRSEIKREELEARVAAREEMKWREIFVVELQQ